MTHARRARCVFPKGLLPFVSLVASVLAFHCGGSPSAPDEGDVFQLTTGLQTVTFMGQDVSTDPEYPPCTNLRAPIGGKFVNTAVVLERAGREWAVHSAAGAGTLQIRFHQTAITRTEASFEGTVEGWAMDVTDFLHPATGVKVTITDTDGSATLTARISRESLRIEGRIAGLSTFTDPTGLGGTCQAISFAMQPTRIQ